MEDGPSLSTRNHVHPEVPVPLIHMQLRLRVCSTYKQSWPTSAEAMHPHRLLQVAMREVPWHEYVVQQARQLQWKRQVVKVETLCLLATLPQKCQRFSQAHQLCLVLLASPPLVVLEVAVHRDELLAEVRAEPLPAQPAALRRQHVRAQSADDERSPGTDEVPPALRQAQRCSLPSLQSPGFARADDCRPLDLHGLRGQEARRVGSQPPNRLDEESREGRIRCSHSRQHVVQRCRRKDVPRACDGHILAVFWQAERGVPPAGGDEDGIARALHDVHHAVFRTLCPQPRVVVQPPVCLWTSALVGIPLRCTDLLRRRVPRKHDPALAATQQGVPSRRPLRVKVQVAAGTPTTDEQEEMASQRQKIPYLRSYIVEVVCEESRDLPILQQLASLTVEVALPDIERPVEVIRLCIGNVLFQRELHAEWPPDTVCCKHLGDLHWQPPILGQEIRLAPPLHGRRPLFSLRDARDDRGPPLTTDESCRESLRADLADNEACARLLGNWFQAR
mmetsp:Transcript_78221/g.203821  ORF Transcript_78221/g.203821 Transcript_78221/m.203821 type:complete len:505 (-) Transcript_78221:62-1576(-)